MPANVLLADDNEDMLVMVRTILAIAGFDVICEAIDGGAAVGCWRDACTAGLELRAIVLDHDMPKLTGIEVARLVRSEAPQQRILLLSAYLDADVRAQAAGLSVECVDKKDVLQLPGMLQN